MPPYIVVCSPPNAIDTRVYLLAIGYVHAVEGLLCDVSLHVLEGMYVCMYVYSDSDMHGSVPLVCLILHGMASCGKRRASCAL